MRCHASSRCSPTPYALGYSPISRSHRPVSWNAIPKSFRQRRRLRGDPIHPSLQDRDVGLRGDDLVCHNALTSLAVGVGLFLTPGLILCLYAFAVGQGDFKHGFSVALSRISRGYFQPELGGPSVPVCDGKMSDLTSGRPLFLFLQDWFVKLGGVWKLEFGPKAFLIISDPTVAKYILKENMLNYNKGLLAEILEPIMGKGLIPADIETWKVRRRVITPAFHNQYLRTMTAMFGRCTLETTRKFNTLLDSSPGHSVVLNMEDEFLNLALDIIGLGVFNFDFGSISKESPVIKAVYAVLQEAEHRSLFYFPYWNIPGAGYVVPRLRRFHSQIDMLKGNLDYLIDTAKAAAQEDDLEALQNRDYSKVADPSLLRFLIEMRGEDHSNLQLKDDLMTFLIAGHETTAAVLTWALYLLGLNRTWMQILSKEVDSVVQDDVPTMESIGKMENLRLVLAEALRLYPQPPVLLRRAIDADTLPGGLNGPEEGFPIGPGADLIISTWNLHRSPYLWKDPEVFNPDRFREPFLAKSADQKWAGYKPNLSGFSLYPDEQASDFAFLPFGGGGRKCVGDQFAFLEASVCLAMLIRRFNFELAGPPESVQMETGATIHTKNGLMMRVSRREHTSEEETTVSPVLSSTSG